MDQAQMNLFQGTSIYDALLTMDRIYTNIAAAQKPWREACVAVCPEGCGTCCLDFEPDILAAEALYTAAWLYFNRRSLFDKLLTVETVLPSRSDCNEHPCGCVFFDPKSTAHCTIYGGRTLICRLFGYCGDHGKNGELRWKPCRFIPDKFMNGLEHRQYTATELIAKYNVVPPDMSSFTSEVMGIFPGNNGTKLLRDVLPAAAKKVNMIISFIKPPEPKNPNPSAPGKTGKTAA